jgi:hypothetical protein
MLLLKQELSVLVMGSMSFNELSFFHTAKIFVSKKIPFLIFFWAIKVTSGKPLRLFC